MASKKKTKKKSAKKTSKKKTSRSSGGPSGIDNDIVDALGELSAGWQDTEEQAFGDNPPDGRYQVRVKEVGLNRSQGGIGRLQCSWQFQIASGPAANRMLFEHSGLDTEMSRSFFRGMLGKLGQQWPDDPKQLPAVLKPLVGTYAQVRAVTKGEFQNVYVEKALDEGDIELEGDTAADTFEPPADDTPAKTDFASEGEVGDRVYCDEHGAEYPATVDSYDATAETALLKFDDGDKNTYPYDQIHFATEGAAAEPDAPSTPQKGDKCEGRVGGDWYPGTIARSNQQRKQVHVKFDDGDEANFNFDSEDLRMAEGAPETGSTETTASGVEVTFTSNDLSRTQVSKVMAMGKKWEFDVKDYTDAQAHLLLADIAEWKGIRGTFEDAATLLSKIEAA